MSKTRRKPDQTKTETLNTNDHFDLEAFLPFLMNQAAEATSRAFQPAYRDGFGLSRTQWRVLAITGRHGERQHAVTSRDICNIAHEEKSRVSRAVSALQSTGLIEKTLGEADKRTELLSLTDAGRELYRRLGQSALRFDQELRDMLGAEKEAQLRDLLSDLHEALERRNPE